MIPLIPTIIKQFVFLYRFIPVVRRSIEYTLAFLILSLLAKITNSIGKKGQRNGKSKISNDILIRKKDFEHIAYIISILSAKK